MSTLALSYVVGAGAGTGWRGMKTAPKFTEAIPGRRVGQGLLQDVKERIVTTGLFPATL